MRTSLVVVAACVDDDHGASPESLPPLPIEVVEGDQPRAEDYEILGAVREAVWEDEQVGRRPIGIDVHRGVVTLTGVVDDVEAKRHALARAGGVDGVQKIVDRLRVRGEPAVNSGGGSEPGPAPGRGGRSETAPGGP